VEQIAIGLVAAATGEGHVARPGIARVLGAADEQELGAALGAFAEDGGNGGAGALGGLARASREAAEARRDGGQVEGARWGRHGEGA
jgi:hypothetical protein